MVQGRLLTTHPGSVHGGGEAPGGGSPLRQGAGKSSPGAPDLGSAAAAEQRRDRKKRVPSSRVSGREEYICQRGSPEAERGAQAPPRAARGGAAWAAPGSPL